MSSPDVPHQSGLERDTPLPAAPPPETHTDAQAHVDGKLKKSIKEKKMMPSDVQPEMLSKFSWHKYPEATEFLCKIQSNLFVRGLDGKRVREMTKLKEKTRNELLHWWDDHAKEGQNKGDMHELIYNFYKNCLQLNDWAKYDGSTKSNSTTPVATVDAEPKLRVSLTKNAGAELLDGILAPLLQAIKGRAR